MLAVTDGGGDDVDTEAVEGPAVGEISSQKTFAEIDYSTAWYEPRT